MTAPVAAAVVVLVVLAATFDVREVVTLLVVVELGALLVDEVAGIDPPEALCPLQTAGPGTV